MTKDQTINILDFYKTIDKEIKLYSRQIKDIEDKYYSLSSTSVVGGGGDKYSISNPTERKALAIPTSVSEEYSNYQNKVDILAALKKEISKEISELKYIYKYILVQFYIEDKQWLYISTQINYSERQCKNIRNVALAKLGKKFKENKTIKKHKFPQQEDCPQLPEK